MIEDIVAYYRERLERYGASPEAVQYPNAAEQRARFQMLRRIDPGTDFSLVDFGCGLGHLLTDFRASGWVGDFTGIEIVPEFVQEATKTFAEDPLARFELQDYGALLEGVKADYVVSSGVFNNARPGSKEFSFEAIEAMWQAAERGIGFNFLSAWVDYLDPSLAYLDPGEVLAFLRKRLGANAVLFNDYVYRESGYPYEVTIFAYRAARMAP